MHNRRIPTLLLILIFTLALLSPVCAEKVQAKASLGVKSFRITKGNSRRLYVKGSKKKVKWKTSNKAVAVVNKTGLVTAKKGGTATITAKVGKKKLKCKVKVRGLNRNRITMHRNLKYKLKVMNGAAGSSWKSSNSRIAKVSSDGMVTAKASGKCFISCVSGGKKLSCEINVAKLNKSVINLGQGGSSELVRTGSITACKWSSSNNTVASVNKYGDVYGVAGGTAVVTCSCGSAKLKCTVYVKGNNIVTARSYSRLPRAPARPLQSMALMERSTIPFIIRLLPSTKVQSVKERSSCPTMVVQPVRHRLFSEACWVYRLRRFR